MKDTLEDPEFLADANLLISYVPGEKIDKLVDQILSTPPDAKKSLQFLVRTQKIS